jgi:hypothetical protein
MHHYSACTLMTSLLRHLLAGCLPQEDGAGESNKQGGEEGEGGGVPQGQLCHSGIDGGHRPV